MITLTPGSSSIDVNHVLEIIEKIGDAGQAKARLLEIQNTLDLTNAAIERSQSIDAELSQKIRDHEKSVAEHNAAVDAIEKRTAELNDLASGLAARESEIAAREKAHKELVAHQYAELVMKSSMADAEKHDAANMEMEAKKRIVAMRDDLAARLAKLKELASVAPIV